MIKPLEKPGLTTERLEQLNHQLVVGSVNSFGITGPLKDDAGLDQVIQGMSGLMSVTGSGADTYRVGVPIVDITSGMICAFGIVSALVGYSTGNAVSHLTTSLLETALNLSVIWYVLLFRQEKTEQEMKSIRSPGCR